MSWIHGTGEIRSRNALFPGGHKAKDSTPFITSGVRRQIQQLSWAFSQATLPIDNIHRQPSARSKPRGLSSQRKLQSFSHHSAGPLHKELLKDNSTAETTSDSEKGNPQNTGGFPVAQPLNPRPPLTPPPQPQRAEQKIHMPKQGKSQAVTEQPLFDRVGPTPGPLCSDTLSTCFPTNPFRRQAPESAMKTISNTCFQYNLRTNYIPIATNT